MVNTIIANNLGQSPEVFGRIYTYGNNLIRERGSAVIDVRPGNANIFSVDPGLAPLANNGGPTLTMRVPPNSPAHDAGSNCVLFVNGCDVFPHLALGVDQRGTGYARSRGGEVDIGAFELGSVLVSNSQDSGAGSLRQAIADALPGDVVTFSPSHFNQPRIMTLASTLVVDKPLGILGPGSSLLTLDAANQRRHLSVDAPATLTLSGMRFTRGNPGASADGGAILVNQGTLNANDIVIEDSTANAGGCIYNNGSLDLTRVRLSGCRANFSAGLFNAAGRTATIRDSRIENHIATGPGGGISNPAGATLVLMQVSVSGNQATIGAGLNSYGTVTLTNTTFSGNTAVNGGAMYLGGLGTTTLTHATVTANTAQLNGGIAAEFDAVVNLQGSLIAGNTRTVDQAPDAGGNFTSFGHNLIGDTFATVFRPNSPSLVGNLLDVPARLAALADNGGSTLTHAPLHDSPIIDAAGPGSAVDGRGLQRPVDFTHIVNASGGNGSDIGAYELQIATPTAVVAESRDGALSVAFEGGNRGGAQITAYTVTCGTQSATGPGSPIVVSGLANGTAYSCRVAARAGNAVGIQSAPSAPATPSVGVTITSPPPPQGQFRRDYTHTVVASAPAAVSYAVASGALPPGLSLDPASGVISGMPTVLGTYAGTLRATDTEGRQATQPFSIQVVPTEPDAPIIGTAVAGDRRIEVYFTPPANDGGSPITNYSALCSFASSGTASPIVVNNLTNGVPQRCRVFAINAVGGGLASAPSNEVTPKAPTTTSVTSSATEVVAGELVTFTASVTPAIATGTVSFDPGPSADACTAVALVNGSASCTTRFRAAGTFAIQASYSGDAVHTPASGQLATGQTVVAPTITITPDLSDGTVNGSYGPVQLSAVGGLAPHAFAITQGSLPAGLTLSTTGILSGTPASSGSRSFTVTATDANQFSGSRDYTVSFIGAPGAPTDVIATRGNAQVNVAFVAPVDNGGSPITGYTASCGNRTQSGSASPLVVTGLTNGTPVTCTVFATNAFGDGAASAPSASVTPATVPGAPTGVTAASGNGSATLTFAPPVSTGGAPVSGYTASCLPGTASANGTASPLTVTGLTNGTLYTCRVTASNAIGSGPESAAVNVIPAAQAIADVIVGVSNGTGFVAGGLPTVYTITVRNSGPAGVSSVRVRSVLDADFTAASWTCSGQGGGLCAAAGSGTTLDQPVDLPLDGSVTFRLTANVAVLPETPVSILVSAEIPTPFTDPNTASNVATDGPDMRGVFRDGME